MSKRGKWLGALALAGGVLAALLGAGNLPAKEVPKNMTTLTKPAAPATASPVVTLDREAPAVIRTATFALG
ncbi:MAG: hypothetical protein KQJ78_10820 [Deltaproteobacteria bacterium]|nr:hypothetical protein [Deltaproteobacteria bacterium]